jgi:hypothetical protein
MPHEVDIKRSSMAAKSTPGPNGASPLPPVRSLLRQQQQPRHQQQQQHRGPSEQQCARQQPCARPPPSPHRRRAVAVMPQTESKALPQPQQPRSDREEQLSELQVNRALTYLDDVKTAFRNQPHVYHEFLDIMTAFSGTEKDTPPLMARMKYLFRNHPRMFRGFKTFLQGGYKICLANVELREVERLVQEREEIEQRVQALQEAEKCERELLRTVQESDSGNAMTKEQELPSCPFCIADYDTDLLLISSEMNKLPVSCRWCSYTICYSCLQEEQQRQSQDRTNGEIRMWLEYPSCKYERGFSMEHPSRSIHRPFCNLLARCRLLTAPKEADFPNQMQLFEMQLFDLVVDSKLVEDCPAVAQVHARIPPPPDLQP